MYFGTPMEGGPAPAPAQLAPRPPPPPSTNLSALIPVRLSVCLLDVFSVRYPVDLFYKSGTLLKKGIFGLNSLVFESCS